jgi:hypothetical protein
LYVDDNIVAEFHNLKRNGRMHMLRHYSISFSIFIFVSWLFLPLSLSAHHGWGWATGEEFEITGEIVDVRLGNPHGEVELLVEGISWLVEVGQPWRNKRAGLTDELAKGRTITVHGHRSADESKRLVKAERVVIDGRDYVLYSDGES